MIQSLTLSLLLIAGVLLAVWGCKTSRSDYESAPYSIVLKNGDYELRNYPELTIVETAMQDTDSGGNSGFRKLFGYISGKNQSEESIAMTTPVFISDDRSKMAFVLPANVSSGKIPTPLDRALSIKRVPSGRFAVLRFKGSRSATKESENIALLTNWIAGKNLAAIESPIFGCFDPPWTPGFLRNNEVMLRISNPMDESKKTPLP